MLLKNINGYERSNQVQKGKLHGKSYSGSKIRCMQDHAKHTARTDPDHIIFHAGMEKPRLNCKEHRPLRISIKNQVM